MDATAFRESVESAMDTELTRLGSQKLLLALTDAELERETVLAVAAASERSARETFAAWADSEENERARAAFEEVATEEREHYERVVEHLPEGTEVPEATGPLHEYLRGREDTVERIAAGFVGRGLVSVRLHTQVISFFINEADRVMPDVFRELKAETEAMLERGLDLLEAVCETDDDWERAREAAEEVVRIAYDEYAGTLEGMGLDPKPIC